MISSTGIEIILIFFLLDLFIILEISTSNVLLKNDSKLYNIKNIYTFFKKVFLSCVFLYFELFLFSVISSIFFSSFNLSFNFFETYPLSAPIFYYLI